MGTIKDEARQLIERMPDDTTWEDIMYAVYVRMKIDRGLQEADEGDVIPQEEVERRLAHWLHSGEAMHAKVRTS